MNIKETFLYKNILSKNLGSEFNANLEWELERAYKGYSPSFYPFHLDSFRFDMDMWDAFTWSLTPQGHNFWVCVSNGELPVEYQ